MIRRSTYASSGGNALQEQEVQSNEYFKPPSSFHVSYWNKRPTSKSSPMVSVTWWKLELCLLRDPVTAAEDLSTSDGQPSTMDQRVIGRWRSKIQGPMRIPSRTRPPPRQHVTLLDDAYDNDEAPSPISPGFLEPADPPSPSWSKIPTSGHGDRHCKRDFWDTGSFSWQSSGRLTFRSQLKPP
jgi:hypothetical protein